MTLREISERLLRYTAIAIIALVAIGAFADIPWGLYCRTLVESGAFGAILFIAVERHNPREGMRSTLTRDSR